MHRRGPWVQEEDNTLLQLVHEQGPNNWVRISQQMHFRSPKQCRERFHQNLKPSLNHTPISVEEGLLIERMVNEMGKRWAEIARRLGNRSDNAVKNWWNGNLNRKRRGLAGQISGQQQCSRTTNGRVEAPYPRASEQRRRYHQQETREISTPDHATVKFSKGSGIISQAPLRERTVALIHQNIPGGLAPILTSAGNQIFEVPMTSPAFSEASNLEPPSMISDHNSVSSASPRTLPSPRLPPLQADAYQGPCHAEQQRRGSVPTYSYYHFADSNRDDVFRAQDSEHEMHNARHWSIENYTSETTSSKNHRDHRDHRMGLESLLN